MHIQIVNQYYRLYYYIYSSYHYIRKNIIDLRIQIFSLLLQKNSINSISKRIY